MIVPHQALSADALSGVIDEYVTRDGTDSTDAGVKVAFIRRSLDAGEMVLVFDPNSGTCDIIPADQVRVRTAEDGD